MAEKEPTTRKTPDNEQDIAAKLKRQYERAQFDADQKESFGKFDVTVPGEGEDTYQSYLDQRPAEGVIRDGEVLRDAQTGAFASADTYENQLSNTQDYYDQKGGLVNKEGEYQPPNYEAMGVLQLAKEAAKARQLGDRAEEEAVREAVEHYLTMDAMKDESESPEEAQARYESEIARYESLVNRFGERPDAHQQQSHEAHDTPEAEEGASQSEDAEEQPTLGKELERYVPGKELELYTGEGGVVDAEVVDVVDADVVDDEDEQEATETEQQQVAKKWWQKTADRFKSLSGASAWAAAWAETRVASPVRDKWNSWLNRGVEDSMTEEEKEKQRKENRYLTIVAGTGLVVLGAIATGVLIANGMQGAGDTVADGLKESAAGWGPGEQNTPVDLGDISPEQSFDPINVASGEGGIELFNNLGLNSDIWYDNAQTLLHQFPQDFYLEGTDVRIAHPGALSQGAQDFINSLR